MNTSILLPLAAFSFLTSSAYAQPAGNSMAAPPYWEASYSDPEKGMIYLRIDKIVSVSLHNYMLDGKIPISELTIDTTGNHSIRIYCPLIKMPNQKNIKINDKLPPVGKQFPQETLSHSIEYYVDDQDTLMALYASLVRATKYFKTQKVIIDEIEHEDEE